MGCPRCSRAVSLEDDCSADRQPPRAHTATGGGRAAKFKASPSNPPTAAPRRSSSRRGFEVYGAKYAAHRVLGRWCCLSCPKLENKTVLAPRGSCRKLPLKRQRKSFRARSEEEKNQCKWQLSGRGMAAGGWHRSGDMGSAGHLSAAPTPPWGRNVPEPPQLSAENPPLQAKPP